MLSSFLSMVSILGSPVLTTFFLWYKDCMGRLYCRMGPKVAEKIYERMGHLLGTRLNNGKFSINRALWLAALEADPNGVPLAMSKGLDAHNIRQTSFLVDDEDYAVIKERSEKRKYRSPGAYARAAALHGTVLGAVTSLGEETEGTPPRLYCRLRDEDTQRIYEAVGHLRETWTIRGGFSVARALTYLATVVDPRDVPRSDGRLEVNNEYCETFECSGPNYELFTQRARDRGYLTAHKYVVAAARIGSKILEEGDSPANARESLTP